MKIECPYCKQHYEITDAYINKNIQCVQCKKEFYIRLSAEKSNIDQPSNIKKSYNASLVGAILCLFLGIIFQSISSWLFLLYGPLYLVSFVLSIVAIAQHNIKYGVILLIANLFLPSLILAWKPALESAREKAKIYAEMQKDDEATKLAESIKENSVQNSSDKEHQDAAQPAKQTQDETAKKQQENSLKKLDGICGIKFGTVFEKKNALKIGKLTNGEPYFAIRLEKYFMGFKDVNVLLTPKTNRIYSICMSKDFSEGAEAEEEFKKVNAVLEKHYNCESKSWGIVFGGKQQKFEFKDATILLRVINLMGGKLEIIATDSILEKVAQKEAEKIAIDTTDTSTL